MNFPVTSCLILLANIGYFPELTIQEIFINNQIVTLQCLYFSESKESCILTVLQYKKVCSELDEGRVPKQISELIAQDEDIG